MSQCKGNFLVMRDGRVVPDMNDYEAAFARFSEDGKNMNKSFTSWDVIDDKEVEFVGCLWEIEGGVVKACVSDREHNMLELGGASIEVAADILRRAKTLSV